MSFSFPGAQPINLVHDEGQMPEYLIRHTRELTGHYGPELVTKPLHGSLLVEASTRVDALAVGYDHLIRAGHAVDTKWTNKYKHKMRYNVSSEEDAERRRKLNYLDMTDDDLDRARKLGVPVDDHSGSTTIVSITAHEISAQGQVLSREASIDAENH